ncbi:tyrosine-protein kinase-like otk [Hyposmocoma kahamanoa]|uniref:tyrosine-protein kinase-like otk n=1 Tax=Hyposmocoma kahamanoa TaxID=1477025 RepID=UPI000E6D9583|nr:tyrosine-protein kinase-like otk [Hyposmocoma kahamanoa]
MSYSRRDPILNEYSLGGTTLNRVKSVRDLGVRFDSKLKFNDHIIDIFTAHISAHKIGRHGSSRKHRAVNDGALRFEPEPYNKKLELNSAGKIHCKVAGGVAPTVQWFLNESSPLPSGVTSLNGTLLVTSAEHRHAGRYTCRATDGNTTIHSTISLDVVVTPRILEPESGEQVHAWVGQPVILHCRATGDPQPTTHWDRNLTILHQQEGVETEGSANASNARMLVLNNGTLVIRSAREEDSDRYGCTAGSAAGLARHDLQLIVHPEGEVIPSSESSGVASKAVVISISVAGAYMLLVLALMVYCRRRRLRRRRRGEKMELEMVEGREKLVEGEEEKKPNGGPVQNGRLLPHEKDSGPDNSEVSGVSRISKKSGQYDHLSVPRSLLTEQIPLGRGEFGEVLVAKIDISQVKKLRAKEDGDLEPKLRPVLVKVLTTKDEVQLADFRRQLDMFSRVRHANVARLLGLCNEQGSPHCMLLEYTDWGDLKSFLTATRTPEETAEYQARVGQAHAAVAGAAGAAGGRAMPPLEPQHRLLLASHLASAASALAAHRITHRDIASRNCVVTSSLRLKLSCPALSRAPLSHEYYKLHDQVIPLRWLPAEVVMEGEYSTKSDVYSFAATIWEIYTKAELPFAKLNDNSVLERLKGGNLEWNIPSSMPEKLAALLKRCWSHSPTDRPQFTEILEEVNALLQETTSDTTKHNNTEEKDTGTPTPMVFFN